jgi:signal transduction histidine kinase
MQRNALRLQKLVNTLLEFSRVQAGRAQACFAAVDLAALTADLASSFRSAIEGAGMRLQVDCPPLEAQVYVDPVMWKNRAEPDVECVQVHL